MDWFRLNSNALCFVLNSRRICEYGTDAPVEALNIENILEKYGKIGLKYPNIDDIQEPK